MKLGVVLGLIGGVAGARTGVDSKAEPGTIIWSNQNEGPATSGSAIDNAAAAVGDGTVFFVSAAKEYTLCVHCIHYHR